MINVSFVFGRESLKSIKSLGSVCEQSREMTLGVDIFSVDSLEECISILACKASLLSRPCGCHLRPCMSTSSSLRSLRVMSMIGGSSVTDGCKQDRRLGRSFPRDIAGAKHP